MNSFKFNITKKELKRALRYSKKHGTKEFGTISMEVSQGSIGFGLNVSKLKDAKSAKSIFEVEAW